MAQSRLGKDAILVPIGTTAERPSSPQAGEIRFNTDLDTFEGYDGISWGSIGGGAEGPPGDQVIYFNDKAFTSDYTVETERNGMSAGPITVEDGVVITVPDGARWVII